MVLRVDAGDGAPPGRDHRAVARLRRRLGRARCPARRRCSPTAASCTPPTATGRAGSRSTASRSRRSTSRCAACCRRQRRRGRVPGQPDRRRHPAPRLAVGRRRLCKRSPTRPASTPRPSAARPPSFAPPRSIEPVRPPSVRAGAGADRSTIESFAESPLVSPNVEILHVGERRLATAVLFPHDHDGSPLPVLLDPYGGPHALRVTQSHNAYLTSQWFADQGFAVVVTDGRGTPGPRQRRGSAPCTATWRPPPLDDQIEALHAVAEQVGRPRPRAGSPSAAGASAAISPRSAVLRRPDVFHAAIAGAPVTEWRLYDTHYTERYLGDPADRRRRLRRQLAAAAGAATSPARCC